MDLKKILPKKSNKSVADILARRHEYLADKYSHRTDVVGSHLFWHHARAAERFSRIHRGLTPFHEENLSEMALAKKVIKRLTRRVVGHNILQKRKEFHKKKASKAFDRDDMRAYDHHNKRVRQYLNIQVGNKPFSKKKVYHPLDNTWK